MSSFFENKKKQIGFGEYTNNIWNKIQNFDDDIKKKMKSAKLFRSNILVSYC